MKVIYHYEMTDFDCFPEHFKGNPKFKKAISDLLFLLKDYVVFDEGIIYLSDSEPMEVTFDLLEDSTLALNKIRETVEFINGKGEPFLFATGS